MKKLVLFFLILVSISFQSCNSTSQKEKEKITRDSLENVRQIELTIEKSIRDSLERERQIAKEKARIIRDSIISVEQNIAIGDILFNISEKQFNNKRKYFLSKCRLPKYESYKNATIFIYKIGEYGFSNLYGWFHHDQLYNIQLIGAIFQYDEYDRVMPDQFNALMNLLKKKYGEPSNFYGLPKWTDLEKGYFKRCATWNIGKKRVEVRVSCKGVDYYLNLEIFRPDVELKIQKEAEAKKNESTIKGADLL